MKKIRVMIVEDSVVVRQLLEYAIGEDARLEVAAAVGSAEEALQILAKVQPDVISMDVRLPGMNGLEATRRIMRERPTPIVVVAAKVESEDLKIAVTALQAGALTVLEKPVGPGSPAYRDETANLCTQLAIMSHVNVITRWREPRTINERMTPPPPCRQHGFKALGVVCSTGGPAALTQLLKGLGSGFPLPILLVQHIGPAFLAGFASWLQTVSPMRIKLVEDRQIPMPSTVYMAANGKHLQLGQRYVEAFEGEPIFGQRPSGTLLLESMADAWGNQALGVLLTGMGEDGARGLLKIRNAGGFTIAEDETSAVVYGMPLEAVRLGAVTESLPLRAIAPRLLELTSPENELTDTARFDRRTAVR